MTDISSFAADVAAASSEVTIPEGDPLEFYIAQMRASAKDASKTYQNTRFGQAKIEDVRRWLVRTAATAKRAWLASFEARKVAKEKDLVSSVEAIEIMRQVTGQRYTKQALSLMVTMKELPVAAKKVTGKKGRPTNFFRRTDVMEIANRRLAK